MILLVFLTFALVLINVPASGRVWAHLQACLLTPVDVTFLQLILIYDFKVLSLCERKRNI